MTTHYFPPVIVCYRVGQDCCQALALGVRRTEHDRYEVLIIERLGRGTEGAMWVPRSRVRAMDEATCCCAAPPEHRRPPGRAHQVPVARGLTQLL